MNTRYQYKAYISYSHRDERWASWLHKALESYRVPRKLVGTSTGVGEVPSRIKPVFRDRDDLSSASDLGGIVRQALSDSENMIVVCSPAAAASHWVNEEIRLFASLGRQKQIFCIIVDGDPAGVGTASVCFPAALTEAGLQEPLAADVRKWADGKRLSKLKLVSGMLGLPLDQLRRRDLQKRQKVWLMTSVAAIAVTAVLIAAITAQIAAQQRRDSGESLVAYKLSELRTMLNVTNDPEGLAKLGQWDQQDLNRLITSAGATENALLNLAMELRKQGNDLYQNGSLSEALKKFQHSWALLAESYRRDRDNQETFFQLGQAEFYIGQIYTDQGEIDKAEEAYMAYAEITRRLILLQPENAEWVLEMAYALTNLGGHQNQRDGENPERYLQLMQSALEYNQIALVLDPKNQHYRSELGQSHAFLADAQRGVCDLEGALQSRQKDVALESEILAEDRQDTYNMQRLAWALSGYSFVLSEMGQNDAAIENLEKVLQLMVPVELENPGLKRTTRFVLSRTFRLAMLKAFNGDTGPIWAISEELNTAWRDFIQRGVTDDYIIEEYASFLLGRARLARTRAYPELADQLLHEAFKFLGGVLQKLPANRVAENMLMLAVFQGWEMKQEFPTDAIDGFLPDYSASSGRTRTCLDASLAARQAIMQGNMVRARELTDYLLEHDYRETSFMRICEAHSLCQKRQ